MITASNSVKNEIISPVRDIRAKVEFYNGSTLVETCNCNDRLISFNIERIGDESRFFGFGICQRLNVHLIDKNRELSFSTSNSIKVAYVIGEESIYPYPTFYISEVRRDENTNELSITAYDTMYPDTAHLVKDITLPDSYTLLYFISAASVALNATGVTFANITDTSPFMLNMADGGNFDGTETIREALNDVAEATQTIYYINSDNKLVFKRLLKDGNADLNIEKKDYITLQSRTNRRLNKIYSVTELGDNLFATTGQSGTTQYIRDNAFWTKLTSSEVATQLENAITAVGGLSINQFDCSWRGNFLLEIGDKIALTTKDNELVYSYVIDDVINYVGYLTETTKWTYNANDAETEATPTTLGDALNQTYAKVDKINRKIDLVASNTEGLPQEIASIKIQVDQIEAKVESIDMDEIGNVQNDISSLRLTTDGIIQEVSKLKTTTNKIDDEVETLKQSVENKVSSDQVSIIVKEELTNSDVTAVTTETGFTFNKDGMTIEKSGSELSTQITENGMTISKSGDTVLTVNNVGVDAANLRATTYLIIGSNSRFEDYDNQTRTGLFWIGD